MAKRKLPDVSISGARIFWRNLSGVEGKVNPAGKRSFAMELPEDLALKMREDGWNCKRREPREEDGAPTYFISVAVGFGKYPPQIWLINSKGKSKLSEDSVGILDWMEIENCDIVIRPYEYSVNGKEGVKAYLKVMYVTITESEFDERYADLPVR